MKVAVIGNGVSSVNTASNLRSLDNDIEIDIFTDEHYHYYPRPRLIDLLADKVILEEIFFYKESWYEEHNINVHLNSPVKELRPEEKEISLFNGERIKYDFLVLANGAVPSLPPIRGIDKRGVFSIRWLDDVLNLKERVKRSGEVIAIGGGLLGLEIAAALQSSGVKTKVIEILPWLLPRQLDEVGGNLLKKILEDRGLEIFTGTPTDEISGDIEVSGVKTRDGRVFKGDTVVITAGIKSSTDLAKNSGLNVNRGVVVDSFLRTSVENIYALGDVAEWNGMVYGIIPPALDQAKIVASNILGENKEYRGTVPSNILKVAGIDLFSIGTVNPDTLCEVFGYINEEKNLYKKFVIKDNKLIGAILLGDRRDAVHIERVVKTGIDISKFKDYILDDSFSWKSVT
ncbi:MAG TPA: FAD-dependent oxidoreductase [bacterium]|nr:FAD-dependent oxidoreductase [bacterium]